MVTRLNNYQELSVVNETQLPLDTDEDGLMSYPVALETGFISEYLSMVQVRKQVREHSAIYFVLVSATKSLSGPQLVI